jgi:hypothetical protein
MNSTNRDEYIDLFSKALIDLRTDTNMKLLTIDADDYKK